jgi:tyrosine-protein phosphatase SIW14
MRTFRCIIGVPGLTNLGVVEEGSGDYDYPRVYRSAQPNFSKANGTPTGRGIKSILNLREESEQIEVENQHMKYFQLRLNVLSNVTVEDFDLIVQTLSNPTNQPILVHCQSGADRTGVACAAYRMAVDGWSLAEAWEELECYGGGGHDVLNIKLKHHLEEYAKAKGFK